MRVWVPVDSKRFCCSPPRRLRQHCHGVALGPRPVQIQRPYRGGPAGSWTVLQARVQDSRDDQAVPQGGSPIEGEAGGSEDRGEKVVLMRDPAMQFPKCLYFYYQSCSGLCERSVFQFLNPKERTPTKGGIINVHVVYLLLLNTTPGSVFDRPEDIFDVFFSVFHKTHQRFLLPESRLGAYLLAYFIIACLHKGVRGCKPGLSVVLSLLWGCEPRKALNCFFLSLLKPEGSLRTGTSSYLMIECGQEDQAVVHFPGQSVPGEVKTRVYLL